MVDSFLQINLAAIVNADFSLNGPDEPVILDIGGDGTGLDITPVSPKEVGGLGLAPGANLADSIAFVEATHGTAPKCADKDSKGRAP